MSAMPRDVLSSTSLCCVACLLGRVGRVGANHSTDTSCVGGWD